MSAMDNLNKVWGRGTVQLGSEGFNKDWKGERLLMSKRFTTNWEELLEIKL